MPSTTQRRSIISPNAMPGRSCAYTPAPRATSQADLTHLVVSSTSSPTVGAPTPVRRVEYLPTPISNSDVNPIITNPLQRQATERNLNPRPWQIQLQALSTPRSMVTGSCSIHWFGQSDITRLVLSIRRSLEIYMWNTQWVMSVRDSEMVIYATWRIVKAFAEAPHCQTIQTYWNITSVTPLQ
jgi:hypothetical protein